MTFTRFEFKGDDSLCALFLYTVDSRGWRKSITRLTLSVCRNDDHEDQTKHSYKNINNKSAYVFRSYSEFLYIAKIRRTAKQIKIRSTSTRSLLVSFIERGVNDSGPLRIQKSSHPKPQTDISPFFCRRSMIMIAVIFVFPIEGVAYGRLRIVGFKTTTHTQTHIYGINESPFELN